MGATSLELGPGWRREVGLGWTLHADLREGHSPDFAASTLAGLRSTPPALDPRWLYDDRGSELYERITATEAYYPTRLEDGLLARHAASLRERVGASAVVELGSGSSTKTRHLLDAWAARGGVHYLPIDVSGSALRGACAELAARYPAATLDALVTSYVPGLRAIADRCGPKLVAFLGSSLGNFDRARTRAFLAELAGAMRPGDHLLLGVDLVKPEPVLVAAYDDPDGWTRRFILNLFSRMNRELGAAVPVEALRYEARWNAEALQVEMWVHVEAPFEVAVGGERVALAAGQAILVEISRKFTEAQVAEDALAAGLEPVGGWTDDRRWFADLLFRRPVP